MITSFMTDQEISNEAYLDFLEMKEKIKIAFSEFHKNQNQTYGKRYFIHSIVQTKTYRTKRHNVWNIRFHDCGHRSNGTMITMRLIYTTIILKDGRTEYLFMNDTEDFTPEKLSAHFLQRYKERYLIPNNIDLRGMPAAIYFLIHNQDKKLTYFIPKDWTEEDIKKRCFWISNQGLFVTEYTDSFKSYITFLDQKNLTQYKANIYEEEALFRIFSKVNPDTMNLKEKQACFSELSRIPNADKIFERYIRRILKTKGDEDIEEQVKIHMENWNEIMKITGNIGELTSKKNERERIQNKSLYLNEEILKLF